MKRQAFPLTEGHKRKRKVKRRLTPEARAKRAAQMKLNRKTQEPNVKVTLYMAHFVNGKTYGPGQIVVKSSLAQQFTGEEEKQIQAEKDLFSTKSTVIGGRGPTGLYTTHRVPDELFDDSFNNPAYTIKPE